MFFKTNASAMSGMVLSILSKYQCISLSLCRDESKDSFFIFEGKQFGITCMISFEDSLKSLNSIDFSASSLYFLNLHKNDWTSTSLQIIFNESSSLKTVL